MFSVIKSTVHSKGDQSWVFFGRNDAKAETPVLWPPHAKSWLIRKDSDGGRDWGQGEKGTTEDEMAGWHHWLDVCEFEWTPGVGDGQGGLACCDSWGRKESDTTEQLNWTEPNRCKYRYVCKIIKPGYRCKYRHVYMSSICVAQVESKCVIMSWCNLQKCSLDGLNYRRLPLSKRTSQWGISFCSGS